jgi:hypothetical protein
VIGINKLITLKTPPRIIVIPYTKKSSKAPLKKTFFNLMFSFIYPHPPEQNIP